MPGNDDDTPIVCQRSFGKRRRKSKTSSKDPESEGCATLYNKSVSQPHNGNPAQTQSQSVLGSWIDNSFGVSVKSTALVTKTVSIMYYK